MPYMYLVRHRLCCVVLWSVDGYMYDVLRWLLVDYTGRDGKGSGGKGRGGNGRGGNGRGKGCASGCASGLP